MKKIYILLTRSTTILSKIVYFVTGDTYTHASISFDDSLQPLYSSARKNGETMLPAGPCKEQFHRGFYKKNPNIPCALYVLNVSDEVYYRAKGETESIIGNSDYYNFNIWGLILCRLNIPHRRKANFFCSQFVAEILRRSSAMKLPKDTSLIRPSDYMCMPELVCMYRGILSDLIGMRAALPSIQGGM